MKPLTFWGGFSDGRLHVWRDSAVGIDHPASRRVAIYTSRRNARREYEDVRKVVIRLTTNKGEP